MVEKAGFFHFLSANGGIAASVYCRILIIQIELDNE